MLEAIAKARLWLDGLIAGTFTSTAEIARHQRCSERAVRITLGLAFLASAIVKTAVEGRLPYGLTASSFSELPILWEEQLHLARHTPVANSRKRCLCEHRCVVYLMGLT